MLGPSWGHFGAILGPSWGNLRAIMGHFATMFGHLGAQMSVASPLKAAKSLRAASGPEGVSPFEALAGLKMELSPRRRAIFVFLCVSRKRAYEGV